MFSTTSEQNSFMDRFNISSERFKSALLTWGAIEEIAEKHEQDKNEHEEILKSYAECIRKCPYVHSLHYRVKDTEHLIEKIIRKNPKIMAEGDAISVSNYKEKITDLMGIRVLLLFKEDWLHVHEYILDNYRKDLYEEPFVYIRKGDERELYEGRVKIIDDRAYRSVHYVIKDKSGCCVEIQVRTLYEEAWSEIDHKLCYPYNMKNEMLNAYMDMMAQMTGMNDNMGTFICHYMERFEDARQKGVLSTNGVYDYILEEIKNCEDPELRARIEEKIRSAKEFRELESVSDLFSSIMTRISTE